DGRGDALDGELELVDPFVCLPVLDRAPYGAGLADPLHGECRALRLRAVPVLEVDRQRQRGRAREDRRMLDDLVQARRPVPAAEGERKARARGSEGLETESGEHPGRAGVPGVRDYERLPGVQ